jgi:hypothetical protein
MLASSFVKLWKERTSSPSGSRWIANEPSCHQAATHLPGRQRSSVQHLYPYRGTATLQRSNLDLSDRTAGEHTVMICHSGPALLGRPKHHAHSSHQCSPFSRPEMPSDAVQTSRDQRVPPLWHSCNKERLQSTVTPRIIHTPSVSYYKSF